MRANILVPALLVFTTAVAFAADESVDYFSSAPSRDLTRLNYYPHSGKLYVAPDFTYEPTNLNDPSSGNEANAHNLAFDLNLIYGLPIEGLRIGAAETWQIHHWSDTMLPSGYVRGTTSAGLSDPTFSAAYRLIDEAPTGLAMDLTLSGSPSLVTDEAAAQTAEGNDGKGYGTLALAANLYWIMPMNDVGLSGTLTRQFTGNVVNQVTPANSYARDSLWTGAMTATDRFHLGEDLYLQGSLAFNFGNTADRLTEAAVASSVQTDFHINPALSVGYRIRNCLVVDAQYTYQNYRTMTSPNGVSALNIVNTVELQARLEI